MQHGGMKTLLILYHSRTGGTAQMARAALRGAMAEAQCRTRLLEAPHASADDVLAADGYIFAAPENLASLSGPMKDFFDRTYYPLLGRIEGRAYASLICAGSDGEGAARQIARIVTGWRLKQVAEPLVIHTHAQTPETILAAKIIPPEALNACASLGEALAAGLAMGVF